MDFQGLVAKLARLEVENFAKGVGVRDRMMILINEIVEWRKDKKVGNSPMMSNGDMNESDVIAYMVEMDTNALVKGETLRVRVTQLAMFANAWLHDRALHRHLEGW